MSVHLVRRLAVPVSRRANAFPRLDSPLSRSAAASSLAAVCPRCFSTLADIEALKFARDVSKDTKKPINISGIKHDGSTRRFYNDVDVFHRIGSVDAPAEETGWAITLADREVHTAKGFPLVLPTRRLALAIALEWQSQRERIVYSTMPLLNIAIVAIDRVRPDKAAFLDKFTPSIVIDSSCVRVSSPPAMKKLQSKHYDPLLRHLSTRHDITLAPTEALMAPTIASEVAHGRLTALLASLDEFTIAALDAVTSLSKSVVVALAVMDGRLSLDAAFEACRVEENYQMRTYGRVDGIYGHGVDVEWTRMVLAAARTAGNLCAREDRGEWEEGLVVDNRSAQAESGQRRARDIA